MKSFGELASVGDAISTYLCGEYVVNAVSEDEAFEFIYNRDLQFLGFGFTKEQYRVKYKFIKLDLKTHGIVYKAPLKEIHEGW